jgi:hypothetical protein
MNLSPQDRKEVLEMVARNIARELILGGGAAMGDLVLLPISVAEKMLSMDGRTIKARIPWVELAANRSAVRLSDVQAYIAAKTRNLEQQSA